MKTTFLFLAEGFEEIEAIATIDVLRRGEVNLKTVSISDRREAMGAHGVTIVTDLLLEEVNEQDIEYLIFPGGMPGAGNLSENTSLMKMLQQHFDRGGRVAAICAAPALVLGKIKTDRQYKMTCYPGFESYLPHACVMTESVVTDGRMITGKGPAFAVDFGLAILRELVSEEKAREVAAGMLKEK